MSFYHRSIDRFLEAQKRDYKIAYEEISEGKKRSHWIWYIYPQIKGLGMSFMDQEYSIKSIRETIEYINEETLFKHLIMMTKLLLDIEHNDIKEVMWYPDDLKLRSCMTLFYVVSGNQFFEKVIDKFYQGDKDLKTIHILKEMLVKEKNFLEPKYLKVFENRLNTIEREENIKLEKRKEEEKKLKKEKEKERGNELRKLKEKKEKENEKDTENELRKEKEREKGKEKEKEKEINDKKEIKNEEIKENIEYKNRIDNKTLCAEEPMDLDDKSIQNKNNIKSNEVIRNQQNININNINKKEMQEPKGCC